MASPVSFSLELSAFTLVGLSFSRARGLIIAMNLSTSLNLPVIINRGR